MNKLFLCTAVALILFGNTQTHAVELLISGDFEDPVGTPGINGWDLQEFSTPGGGGAPITDTAGLSTFDPQSGVRDLFLMPFNGNGALGPAEGNFDNDNLPAGDVDGGDFLEWQRGNSPTGPLDQADLTTWQGNYNRVGGQLTNAVLSQTAAGSAGETYTFSGWSRWEDNYSGGAGTLAPTSPLGAVPTPTTNTMKLEFLDSGGGVLGSQSLDLLADGQSNLNLWKQHTITSGAAPVGTVNIRVTAEARDMVFNTDPLQGAFFDNFSLTGASAPATELLINANVDDVPPSALDFWDLTENPASRDEILRTAGFANHTPGGTLGVWLSAFFGSHPIFEPLPVDGTMSQTVAAVVGGSYSFSGWSRFEANYSGGVDIIDAFAGGFLAGQPSPTSTEIVLEFLDGGGSVIGSSTIDVKADRILQSPTNNANDDLWYQHTLGGIAPVGSVSVRLSGKMIDGVFNTDPGQSAFFDDFSLDGPVAPLAAAGAVPEPATATGMVFGALMLSLWRGRQRNLS